jgi:mannose-6-phosphate isomerase-like protein (cupin superfamily)
MNLSVSQLSRLERGEQELTVVDLMRLADYFDVSVTHFFLDTVSGNVKITRASDRPSLTRNFTDGKPVVQELLVRAENVKMEPSFLHIPAHGDSGSAITHEGEEFLTILAGKLTMWIGDEHYELEEGDTIYYPCSIPHRWRNPCDMPSKVLAVSTPPSY